MKSRGTTYLLLAAVAAVWGVVGWKIFAPAADTPPTPVSRPSVVGKVVAADTLLLDYPDPFLKGAAAKISRPSQPAVRARPPAPVPREKVQIVHLGTIASDGKPLYILTIGSEQYELARGTVAEGFRLSGCDRDSIYVCKNGITYGVKLCE